MDTRDYFKSLGYELEALKHRVRHLIADSHWQTDGEWKESVLRQVLRRHLPENAVVGRGFVVAREASTHQIDILIRDASKPILFRDGDLSFVTPDAVLGLIEVKSRVNTTTFADAVRKMTSDIDLVRKSNNTRAFAAVFAFEADKGTPSQYLEAQNAAKQWNQRVDFSSVGPNRFHRYLAEDPLNPELSYNCWHSYELRGLAAGYFVHNVVDAISPESVFHNEDVWFPRSGKEPNRNGVIRAEWAAGAG